MAAGWELFAMGMGMELDPPSAPNLAAATAYMYGLPSTDTLRIDDLLDFSSSATAGAHPSSALTPTITTADHHPYLGGCNSNSNSSSSFADDLYTIHCEEAAELEWLSQFVEDSFSVDIPASYPTPTATHLRQAEPPSSTGKGARSKRSRPHVWSSLTAPPLQSSSSSSTSSSSSATTSELSHSPKPKAGGGRRRSTGARELEDQEGGPRRCTHCASEKTPQWRLGPQGPKTLCNACGVRYKSGRLVPEYRPAASPTFVLAQHSNSHRKVMELRHKNEMLLPARHDARNSSSSSRFMDYEVY